MGIFRGFLRLKWNIITYHILSILVINLGNIWGMIRGKGCYAISSSINLHFHGCMRDDFCDGTKGLHYQGKESKCGVAR